MRFSLRQFILIVAALLLSTDCASQSHKASVAPNVDVLILAPQGADPAKDNVGFNDLSRALTQTFSDRLTPMLRERGYTTINIIDQSTRYDVGQKLAMYSIQQKAKSVIVLTMETATIEKDIQIQLQAQYIRQEFVYKNGQISGVLPTSNAPKSYFIRGSVSGDNPGTMTDLAKDYIGYLSENGLAKRPPPTVSVASVTLGSHVDSLFLTPVPEAVFKPTDTIYISITTHTESTTPIKATLGVLWTYGEGDDVQSVHDESTEGEFDGDDQTAFHI